MIGTTMTEATDARTLRHTCANNIDNDSTRQCSGEFT
jgi:hypothetical protein